MGNKIQSPNTGIYKLTCANTDKIYIGKATNLTRRFNRHKNCSTDKGSSHLKRAIMKYGWDAFNIEILETFENFDKLTDNDHLLERESYYIELFDTTNIDKGYNICKYSTDRTGIPCSEETKLKIGQSNLGKKKHTDESKEKIRQANTGKKHSEETKEKIRQDRLGKKQSDETREKLRIYRLNNPRSEECREGIRQKLLGRKYSEETLKKMKANNKGKLNSGRKHSDEERLKMRLAKLGKPRSEETKEKIRQTRARNKEIRLAESQINC